MKRCATIFLSLLLINFYSAANAATIEVGVEGLEFLSPDTIWSYQINFDVTGGTDWFVTNSSVVFNTTGQHQLEVIPGLFIPNWNLDSNLNLATTQLVILADDKDYGDPSKSPLRNGTLFTVQFPDAIQLSLASDSFLLASDLTTRVDMLTIPASTVFGAGNNTLTFNAVPIPPALLLFGSGLIGLVGLRRKIKK